MTATPKLKVAALHVAPAFLDKSATVEKAVSLIQEAARSGAQLIVFPESYVPAFPVWAALWAPIYNHDLFERLVHNSLQVPGPEISRIAREAKRHGVYVSLGFSERSDISEGCLWNSNALIAEDGQLINHHRKLVPTFYEKLIWANGDGAGLRVASTRLGRIGALICGENTNPLARYSLMCQGEQVHISTWPPLWPTRPPKSGANYDNVAANRIRTAAHCFEAKAFGIACAGFMDRAMRDFFVQRDPSVADILDSTPRAVSLFVDPTGAQIGESLQKAEDILYGEFDLTRCIEPKQFHDVVGYYNRFDVFDLRITRERLKPAAWTDRGEAFSPILLEDDPN